MTLPALLVIVTVPLIGTDREAMIATLKPVGSLVGQWNGVATPKDRDSRRKRIFWREQSEWEWTFDDGPQLKWTVDKGRKFKGGLLSFDAPRKTFTLVADLTEGGQRTYVGAVDDGKLVLETTENNDGDKERLWLYSPNNKRFLYVVFVQPEGRSRFVRALETGFTREGVQFATDSSGPVCIVTGGLGTIKVTHKGKTYYVCCKGCQQEFNDDPEKIIAEAKKR